MNKTVADILAVGAIFLVTWLVGEGVVSIALRGQLDHSVTNRTYLFIKKSLSTNKGTTGNHKGTTGNHEGPPYTWLLDSDQIDPLLPKLKMAGVALGNSPYDELKTDQVAINMSVDGCTTQKSHVDKTMTYLRSNAFHEFDPINIFYDSEVNLDPEIRKLIDTYGIRLVKLTTNEHGERNTAPVVTSNRKVLIAGDSVANGTGIDDSETISSQLQALDLQRQYINLGIADADARDSVCALKKAAQRYKGQIEELIYVYSENDFSRRRRYGTPREVIDWLRDFAKAQGIAKVTVVYAPYIYNVVPQYTGSRRRTRAGERAALAKLVGEAGFRHIDIADVALAEADRAKTQFAALSVFVDHAHLSPYGVSRLVERIRAGNNSQ